MHGMDVLNSTGDTRLLCGGCACGNVAGSGTCYEANVSRFRSCACANRNVGSKSRWRCFDGQMTEMAHGTGVGRRIDMMMPNHPERCSQDEREERYGNHQTPDSFSIRHRWGALQRPFAASWL